MIAWRTTGDEKRSIGMLLRLGRPGQMDKQRQLRASNGQGDLRVVFCFLAWSDQEWVRRAYGLRLSD